MLSVRKRAICMWNLLFCQKRLAWSRRRRQRLYFSGRIGVWIHGAGQQYSASETGNLDAAQSVQLGTWSAPCLLCKTYYNTQYRNEHESAHYAYNAAPFKLSRIISADKGFKLSSEPRREPQLAVPSVIDVRADVKVEDSARAFQVEKDAGGVGIVLDVLIGGRLWTRSNARLWDVEYGWGSSRTVSMLADLGFDCGDGREKNSAELASGDSSDGITGFDLLNDPAIGRGSKSGDSGEEGNSTWWWSLSKSDGVKACWLIPLGPPGGRGLEASLVWVQWPGGAPSEATDPRWARPSVLITNKPKILERSCSEQRADIETRTY